MPISSIYSMISFVFSANFPGFFRIFPVLGKKMGVFFDCRAAAGRIYNKCINIKAGEHISTTCLAKSLPSSRRPEWTDNAPQQAWSPGIITSQPSLLKHIY